MMQQMNHDVCASVLYQCAGDVPMCWKCCNALEMLQCVGNVVMCWRCCNVLEMLQCAGDVCKCAGDVAIC